MSGSQQGLPVPGYRPQSNDAVAAVSRLKIAEERILRELDALAKDTALKVDPRCSYADAWMRRHPEFDGLRA